MNLSEFKSKIRLIQTCMACPEQYDAYLEETQVGYFRLRGGHFTVEVPDVFGYQVYAANPTGDGIFEEKERKYFLNRGIENIFVYIQSQIWAIKIDIKKWALLNKNSEEPDEKFIAGLIIKGLFP